MKRLLQILLIMLFPVLASAQAAGGTIKRPVKKTSGSMTASAKTKMTLHDLLYKPMGLDFDVKTASYRTVRSKLFSKYHVYDQQEKGGRHDFWITTQNNAQCKKMRYNGLSFQNFYYRIDPSGEQEVRYLSYGFFIKKSVHPNIPYQYLDKIVDDYHKLGIDISYTKKTDSAYGTFKIGNLQYEIGIASNWTYDNEDAWVFYLDLWIR